MIYKFTDLHDILAAMSIVKEQPNLVDSLEVEMTSYMKTSELVEKILTDPAFPLAVDPAFIANRISEEDKIGRAQAIVEQFIDEQLLDKKVLDMGCGEGHVAAEMSRRGATVVAFDIDKAAWKQETLVRLYRAESHDEVTDRGPYDLILLFDVLDHSVTQEPVELLKFCKSVLHPLGHMKVRCHPWCSRHGTHLFHSVNKAYLHLFATDEELIAEGFDFLPTVKVIHPIWQYKKWFTEAELKMIRDETHQDTVEPMFYEEPYRSKIIAHWLNSPIDERLRRGEILPDYAICQNFNDHFLTHPT